MFSTCRPHLITVSRGWFELSARSIRVNGSGRWDWKDTDGSIGAWKRAAPYLLPCGPKAKIDQVGGSLVRDLSIRNLFIGVDEIGITKTSTSSQRALFKFWRMGDLHQDKRNWQQVRDYYRSHSNEANQNMIPGDAAIWVQHDHVCKQLGNLDVAEAACRKKVEKSRPAARAAG